MKMNNERVTMKKSWKSLSGCVLVLAMLAGATVETALAYDITNINFDSDPVGQPPAGWSISYHPGAGSTVMVTSAQSVSPSNSLELRSVGQATFPVSTADLQGLGSFFPAASNDYVRFSILLAQSTDQQARFRLVNGSYNLDRWLLQLTFASGAFFAQDSNNYYPGTALGSYVSNQWYDVYIETVPATYTYSLSIVSNGTLIGSVSSHNFQTNLALNGLTFLDDGTFSAGSDTTSVFIDNVSFGAIPEPSGLALIGVAAMAGLWMRRVTRRG